MSESPSKLDAGKLTGEGLEELPPWSTETVPEGEIEQVGEDMGRKSGDASASAGESST